MERFNIYARNGKILDKRVTASYIKEEYDCNNPWRYARKPLLLHGQYMIRLVEE